MVENNEDFVELIQSHLNEYIHAADRKSSILLTAHIAFLGLFGKALINESSSIALASDGILSAVMAGATVLSGLIAGLFAGLVVYPRTPETDSGYMLWSSIINKQKAEYHDEIQSLGEDKIAEEMIDENYQLANVADDKYKYLRYSLISTAAMVIFAVISFIVVV